MEKIRITDAHIPLMNECNEMENATDYEKQLRFITAITGGKIGNSIFIFDDKKLFAKFHRFFNIGSSEIRFSMKEKVHYNDDDYGIRLEVFSEEHRKEYCRCCSSEMIVGEVGKFKMESDYGCDYLIWTCSVCIATHERDNLDLHNDFINNKWRKDYVFIGENDVKQGRGYKQGLLSKEFVLGKPQLYKKVWSAIK